MAPWPGHCARASSTDDVGASGAGARYCAMLCRMRVTLPAQSCGCSSDGRARLWRQALGFEGLSTQGFCEASRNGYRRRTDGESSPKANRASNGRDMTFLCSSPRPESLQRARGEPVARRQGPHAAVMLRDFVDRDEGACSQRIGCCRKTFMRSVLPLPAADTRGKLFVRSLRFGVSMGRGLSRCGVRLLLSGVKGDAFRSLPALQLVGTILDILG